MLSYPDAPAVKRSLTEALCFVNAGGSSDQLLTGKTWIVANAHNASWTDIDILRALIEVVGQLNKSVDFQWRGSCHSFWKGALIKSLGCCVSVGGNPAPAEYDVVEQLMSREGPRFVLNFHRLGYGRTQPKLLQYLLLKDSTHSLGTQNANLLAQLTSQGSKTSDDDKSEETRVAA